MATNDGDYVLGTGDEEVERLGVQHRVWRPHVLDAWARAAFAAGQHLVDVGCGPGYATLDLAALAGPSGRVSAFDRSANFLDVAQHRIAQQGSNHVTVQKLDLDVDSLPQLDADGVWCRWILAFVANPKRVAADIHATLKPGGALVLHEYFDYRMWRLMPRSQPFEEFVGHIIDAWRANGGEPDIAVDLVSWLPDIGFDIVETRPLVSVVGADDDTWRWPSAFVESGLHRLVEIGRLNVARADDIRTAFAKAEQDPRTRMVTPGVLEIIAKRR